MPLRVITQIGGLKKLVEVPPMVMDVAGNPNLSLGRQDNDVLLAEGVAQILLRRILQRLGRVLVTDHRHGLGVIPLIERRQLNE